MSPRWLIYGAYGYTGRRIAREAVRRGGRPILAGRDQAKAAAIAAELDCPVRAFTLTGASAAASLQGVGLVLNCAGPFYRTAGPLLEACLAAGVHYLDITGEIDVIELAASQQRRATEARICIMPAVGFDVVPSDCLAAALHQRLKDATHLRLAFWSTDAPSPGTARTAWETAAGPRTRVEGSIRTARHKLIDVAFADHPRRAMLVPWGDVASAYHTTGIPNIEVYAALPKPVLWLGRFQWLSAVSRFSPLRRLVSWGISRGVPGPSDDDLAQSRSEFWGCATNADGRSVEGTLSTIGGYALTVRTALAAVERVLAGDIPPGFHTPARALGIDFIEQAAPAKIAVGHVSNVPDSPIKQPAR
jgi:short subunit dehydrogenase-like uncharacterized protein